MVLGIDAGSTNYKLIWLDGGRVVERKALPTRPAMDQVLGKLLASGPEHTMVVATGYGRHWLEKSGIAHRVITEIKAQAVGVGSLANSATVLDLGGQDFKVIYVENGKVINFEMNDRCAAGTGRFLEMAAHRLGVSLAEMDGFASRADEGAKLNSMCAVFAESELVSLMARGVAIEAIALGVFQSISQRLVAMVKRMGSTTPFLFTGGGAMLKTLVNLVSQQLGDPVQVPDEPLFTAAFGAALVAENDGMRI
jgi:predicted CoA-substrate-specific enzyme activase